MKLAIVMLCALTAIGSSAMADPAIIAHRGASGLAPENTLAAFAKAIEVGADGIEFDLHLTADGAIVVHHDYRLSPEWARKDGEWITGEGPAIRDLTLAEVRAYDVGRLAPGSKYAKRYPDYQPADGALIPTLGEVLALVKADAPDNFQLWVELKLAPADAEPTSDPIALTGKTVAALTDAGLLDQAVLISFYWPALYHAQRIAPGLKTGYLSAERRWLNNIQAGRPGRSPWTVPYDADDYSRSAPRMIGAVNGWAWSAYWRDATAERLAEAKAAGLRVGVWTIRERSQIPEVRAMDIDVITTDRPDWFTE